MSSLKIFTDRGVQSKKFRDHQPRTLNAGSPFQLGNNKQWDVVQNLIKDG